MSNLHFIEQFPNGGWILDSKQEDRFYWRHQLTHLLNKLAAVPTLREADY